MPKIRSITYFTDIDPSQFSTTFDQAGAFLRTARPQLDAVLPVQSLRLATQPFPQYGLEPQAIPQLAQQMYAAAQANTIDYVSLGCVGQTDDVAFVEVIGDICASVQGVFATASIADKTMGIDLARLASIAALIQRLSTITPDGMTNLYFAALANCSAGAPFLPVAYHGGGDPHFALAIQAADLVVQAFTDAPDPMTARQRLTHAVEDLAAQLVPIAENIAQTSGIKFSGLDISFAPYPTAAESLGGALELLGTPFGGGGLVASASVVMNAVEMANFPRTGFCGLMLPILEDSVLAQRAVEGRLGINDLLLLSAVCGTGLDCIPLAGDIPTASLQRILLDVAALALRLDKPLTARLMPFPNKQAGDKLSFDFEYFADGEILPMPHIAPPGTFTHHPATPFTITTRKTS